MTNSHLFEEFAAKIGDAFRNSPAKDFEKNLRAMLSGLIHRMDLVTRDEFDVQAQVLLRTREKLDALEQRVAALEASARPPDEPGPRP